MGDIIFKELPSLFVRFVETFKDMVNTLSLTVGELYQYLVDLGAWDEYGDAIFQVIEDILTRNDFIAYLWDIPLISVLVGGFITVYMIYQFLTWLLNIIT